MSKQIIEEELDKLPEDAQNLFKWQCGRSGGFIVKLFELIAKADKYNQERLARAFPEEVRAFQKYASVNGWWQEIVDKVIREVGDESA